MSKSRAIGTAFESAVAAFLREHGYPYAERRALQGARDRGDIAGVPGVMLECKAEKSITLAAYMDEVDAQKAHSGAQIAVAVVKRRRRGIGKSYVVMDLEQFCGVIR